MAEPLRNDSASCKSAEAWTGLYVVGQPNAVGQDQDIPRLPSLCHLPSQTGSVNVGVLVPGSEAATPAFHSQDLFDRFTDGDVVWVDSRMGRVRGVLSAHANANTLMLSERCDNLCQFCSQPPNTNPDTELYIRAALSLANFNTESMVGLSGGEPTLNRDAFLRLLKSLNRFAVPTPLHILTNGRSFSDGDFLREVIATIKDRSVLWGIPLYGHCAEMHDELVGARGAFAETVEGLSGLVAAGALVELRIIPVQRNLEHLANIVEFVATHIPRVFVLSVMNLEPKGLARKNHQALRVSHREQNDHLKAAIRAAGAHGIPIRLFNYARCLLAQAVRQYAVKSISDWKNYYPLECEGCREKTQCGGFFTSSVGNFIEKVEPFL